MECRGDTQALIEVVVFLGGGGGVNVQSQPFSPATQAYAALLAVAGW